MSNPFLTAALSYAARRWPVVPIFSVDENGKCGCADLACRGCGKHPKFEHAHRYASTNEVLITKWWTDFPNDNVAIASGRRSGLIVLDIDPRHGGDLSLKTLENQIRGLPRTVKAITGGGGEHYLFQSPPIEVRGRIGMLPGIDVRAEDQLFIAPPSLHQSGRRYEWAEGLGPDDIALARIPSLLLDRILTKNPSSRKSSYSPPVAEVPTRNKVRYVNCTHND
jgi:Bifunctional DNA primase/polymerase, N-terminal